MSATAETLALAAKSNEPKYTEEMHINTLKKMTFEVDKLNDAEITKTKYLTAVSNLASKESVNVDFSDCRLTGAHLQIIFNIIMNREQPVQGTTYNGLNLTGKQLFQEGILTQYTIQMLDKKPNLFYCLNLPGTVALHPEIIRLWAMTTKNATTRILSSDSPETNEQLYLLVEKARTSSSVPPSLIYYCAIGSSAGSAAAEDTVAVASGTTASAAAEASTHNASHKIKK